MGKTAPLGIPFHQFIPRVLPLVKKILPFLLLSGFIGLVVYLGASVLKAGYHYQFDGDEFYHMQIVYVIMQGLKPYTDFYIGPYTPLFYWLFVPIIAKVGFFFSTLYVARYVMIILYILRLLVSFLLVRKLFGKIAALFSLPLILLDPFTVYAGMQIRPDNLMLFVFMTAFLVLTHGLTRRSHKLTILSGFLFAVSVLVLVKIIPAVVVVFGVLLLWSMLTRNVTVFLDLVGGALVAGILFIGYFYLQGALPQLIQQDITDSLTFISGLRYPIPVTFFLQPGNNVMYGGVAKPFTWFYIWALPMIGFGGLEIAWSVALKKLSDSRNMLKIALGLAGIAQWIFLMVPSSAFVQYFLPTLWFYAIFGSVALSELVRAFGNNTVWRRNAALVVFLIAFGYAARSAVAANTYHAAMTTTDQQRTIEAQWKKFPPDEPVFQAILFRPIAYTIPGYVNADHSDLLIRMPIENSLEEKKLKRVFLDDYIMNLLPYKTQEYIRTHYRKLEGGDNIWIRVVP